MVCYTLSRCKILGIVLQALIFPSVFQKSRHAVAGFFSLLREAAAGGILLARRKLAASCFLFRCRFPDAHCTCGSFRPPKIAHFRSSCTIWLSVGGEVFSYRLFLHFHHLFFPAPCFSGAEVGE